MSRNVSFNEYVQEFEHEDSIKINKRHSNPRRDFKKKRTERQNERSRSVTPSSSYQLNITGAKINENGEICFCLPKSQVEIINKQDKRQQEKEEEEEPMMMDNDAYYDPPEFDNKSIYNSLPELKESLLEVEDDPINISVLGRNYRTNSFR
ncbi:hypothetical protein PVAND_004841 [Polypedilum vanderplanki]|uniref:Uncharacterized protein n=1 Tax=Polypedilum vanderplanki TaxID=319348 RepID=A0A9J6BYY8_POLVA|nr:hypothetical protein PVAND_004841 [Polypedilum vanderplanki]